MQRKNNGDIKFSKNIKGIYSVHHKIRQPKGRVFRSLINDVVNGDAAKEMEVLFGIKKIFDNPKPTALIKKILLIASEQDDIVLDFFSGSSTTSEAVFQINKEFEKNLKWLSVQLPVEITSDTEAGKNALKLGYNYITQLAKDRLVKSISMFKYFDTGFKVTKLATSSYKKWKDFQSTDVAQLENALDLFSQSSLHEDWNENKLITELLLIEGFPLDSTQNEFKIGINQLTKIESEMVPNMLIICLDEKIDENLIEELDLDSQTTFICLDNAISNQDKLRLSDKGLIKTI